MLSTMEFRIDRCNVKKSHVSEEQDHFFATLQNLSPSAKRVMQMYITLLYYLLDQIPKEKRPV